MVLGILFSKRGSLFDGFLICGRFCFLVFSSLLFQPIAAILIEGFQFSRSRIDDRTELWMLQGLLYNGEK